MELTGIGKVYELFYSMFAFVRVSLFTFFWFMSVWVIGKDGDIANGGKYMAMAILSFWFLDELMTVGGAFAGGAIMQKTAAFGAYVMLMLSIYFLVGD